MSEKPSPSRLRSGVAAALHRSRFLSLLAGAVCALFAVLVVAGVRAYGDLADARSREAELERLVAEADLRVENLESRIERLASDDAALERVAREELGMLFPEEFVVLLPSEPEAARELAEASTP